MTETKEIARIERQVTDEDIDKYGHMNYAHYLGMYENGHIAFLKARGLSGFDNLESFIEYTTSRGLRAVVRNVNIDYLRELKAGDKVAIETDVSRVGNTSMTYSQNMRKGEEVCSRADITVVFTDLDGKPTPIPEDMRSRL